jgi:hypothetical protein
VPMITQQPRMQPTELSPLIDQPTRPRSATVKSTCEDDPHICQICQDEPKAKTICGKNDHALCETCINKQRRNVDVHSSSCPYCRQCHIQGPQLYSRDVPTS